MSKMSIDKNVMLTDGRKLDKRIYYGLWSTAAILNMSDDDIRKSVALLQKEYACHHIHCIDDMQHPYRMENVAYHRVLLALGLWKKDWKKCTCEQPPRTCVPPPCTCGTPTCTCE